MRQFGMLNALEVLKTVECVSRHLMLTALNSWHGLIDDR